MDNVPPYKRPRLYFGAPLFSSAELTFNRLVSELLEKWFDVYLPQRDGGLVVSLVDQGIDLRAAYESIFALDIKAIRRCHAFLAILDGRSIDEGVAFELGVAYASGKVCVGFQTDVRRLLPIGNNPMVDGSLSERFVDLDDLSKWAAAFSTTDNSVGVG